MDCIGEITFPTLSMNTDRAPTDENMVQTDDIGILMDTLMVTRSV